MDRTNYFYLQLLQEDELDLGFSNSEKADRALYSDQCSATAPGGIVSGLSVAQSSVPALTVVVNLGTAYDQTGQRMRVPSPQTVSVALDNLGSTTAVTTVGNSKIISLFLKFNRNNYDGRPDGNSVTVYFRSDESFSLHVTQGAEGVAPAAPALLSDGILLCDITRAYGQSTIVTGDIRTSRRQWQFAIAGYPRALARGTSYDALFDVLGWYNAHVSGAADKHPAGDLVLSVAQTWKDSSSFAATDVDSGFEEILTTLKAVGSGASGADKTGCAAIVGTANTISAGSLFATLSLLKSSTWLDYAGGGAWADGTTNPATNVEAQLDKVITDLSSVGASPGLQRVGFKPAGNFLAGNAYSAMLELTLTTAATDGAKRIGTEVKGSFTGSAVNLRLVLDELDVNWGKLSRTNTWTGAQTVDNITASGTTRYKLASRSVTRMQPGLYNTPVAVAATLSIYCTIPHGAVLTAISVYFQPGTHVAWPPGTSSLVTLTRVTQTTGGTVSVGSALDPAATLAASNLVRALVISGLSNTMDRTTGAYFVQFTNESGANAMGCTMLGMSVTYTTTEIDDGY